MADNIKAKKTTSNQNLPQKTHNQNAPQAKNKGNEKSTNYDKESTENDSVIESSLIKAVSLLLNEIISENAQNPDPQSCIHINKAILKYS
jgi:hypothetical protein